MKEVRATRLVALLLWLRTRRTATRADIASWGEISPKQSGRDVESLMLVPGINIAEEQVGRRIVYRLVSLPGPGIERCQRCTGLASAPGRPT